MERGPTLPGVETDDEDRIVLHVDLDCFYAACERLREPALEGEPVVVGMGYEPGEPDGAVATASYEAREHGVESAQAISTALEKLPKATERDEGALVDGEHSGSGDDACGDAAADDPADGAGETAGGDSDGPVGYYRPVDMSYYESVAEDVKAILHDSAATVREVSIDEAYLDVTERTDWSVAEGYARHVKQRIEREVGLVASVGAAPTMHAAKVASDHDKPDGLVVVEPGDVESFLAPLPVEDLHGIGPVTARTLREHDVETVAELAEADRDWIRDNWGDRGLELQDRARGHDPRVVEPRGRPKSLSRESAFAEPEDDPEQVRERLCALASAVADRARSKDAIYRTIGIKVVLPPYDVNTRERSLSGPVDDPDLVERVALDLHEEFADDRPRKVGVRVSNLEFEAADQSTLGGWDDGASDANAAGESAGGGASDGARTPEERASDEGGASDEARAPPSGSVLDLDAATAPDAPSGAPAAESSAASAASGQQPSAPAAGQPSDSTQTDDSASTASSSNVAAESSSGRVLDLDAASSDAAAPDEAASGAKPAEETPDPVETERDATAEPTAEERTAEPTAAERTAEPTAAERTAEPTAADRTVEPDPSAEQSAPDRGDGAASGQLSLDSIAADVAAGDSTGATDDGSPETEPTASDASDRAGSSLDRSVERSIDLPPGQTTLFDFSYSSD